MSIMFFSQFITKLKEVKRYGKERANALSLINFIISSINNKLIKKYSGGTYVRTIYRRNQDVWL